MGYSRVLLARPIKITSSEKSFSFIQGGTNLLSITEGLYSDFGSLLKAIQTQVRTVDASFLITLSDCKWYSTSSGGQYQFSFTSTMADILGFNSTTPISIAVGSYALYGSGLSTHCWLSTYASSDQQPWARDIRTNFSGQLSRTGQMSGVSIGDTRYEKEFRFMYEPALNVWESEATSQFYADRCFEKFIYNSMTVQPTSGSSANPKGFWIYYDYSNLSVASHSSTYAGINYLFSSNPDIKTLAHVEPNYSLQSSPVVTKGRDFYNVVFDAHTMTITEDYI